MCYSINSSNCFRFIFRKDSELIMSVFNKERKKDPNFYDAATLNTLTFDFYFNRLCELAMSVFKWENLPPTIDERFLELTLLEKGYCLYFNDDVIGDLALPCTIGGELDVYRIPISRWAYSPNGYQQYRTKQDSVLIFNNYSHTPTYQYIELFARRIAECERTVDVNVKAQKTPVMVLSSDKQRNTMKNLYLQYDGNYPFIFGNKDIDTNALKTLNTQAPYVADKITALKQEIWNEALTWLGISNLNVNKKERLVTDEVATNLGFVNSQRYTRLNARQQACEEINRKFDTNISVNFRDDTALTLKMKEVNQNDEEIEVNE